MQSDLLIEALPLGDLLPYAANARTHSGEQVAKIAASDAGSEQFFAEHRQ